MADSRFISTQQPDGAVNPGKASKKIDPEVFLAKVDEAASKAVQATADFLIAIEHGCREKDKIEWVSEIDGYPEIRRAVTVGRVLVPRWEGAIRPECDRAMEACAALGDLFVCANGKFSDPYTAPASLAEHAKRLRLIHRTAVNLYDGLYRIRLLLAIPPLEIAGLRTLKDALQGYAAIDSSTDGDATDDPSRADEPASNEVPQEPKPARLHLHSDGTVTTVTLDGKVYRLDSDEAHVLKGLIETGSDWITGDALKPSEEARPDRIIKRLPQPIQDCIESRPGTGYRLIISAGIA